MKRINLRSISERLSDKEMKLAARGWNDPNDNEHIGEIGGGGGAWFYCDYITHDGTNVRSGCIFGIGTATALCEIFAYNGPCYCMSCQP